jgi:peptide-methionine (S)-S-oxide reductase
MGDHTESFQVDYDPEKITYEKLLEIFWSSHNPCAKAYSRQYMSAVFYSDDEQKKAALESRDKLEKTKGKALTVITDLKEFTLAEDYHQKYMLRNNAKLMAEFKKLYPENKDFVNSTAAARVNAYLGGNGTARQLEEELPSYGLSDTAAAELKRHSGAK